MTDKSKDNLITELHTQLIEKEQKINKLNQSLLDIKEYIESRENGICVDGGIEKPTYNYKDLGDFYIVRRNYWNILDIVNKALGDKENGEE